MSAFGEVMTILVGGYELVSHLGRHVLPRDRSRPRYVVQGISAHVSDWLEISVVLLGFLTLWPG